MSTLLSRTQPERRLLRRAGIPKGCLIALAVFFALVVAVAIFVAVSWKGWVANLMTSTTNQAVAGLNLPQADKDRINGRVTQLADDFKSGKVSLAQLQSVGETLVNGPLMPFAMVQGFEQGYVSKAKLNAEEQAAAERSLERLARGIFEKKIPLEAMNDVMVPISDPPIGKGGRRIRQPDQVTPEQVKEFIALAKAKADDAKIPDEPFKVDVAGELVKAIDEGVAKVKP